MKTKKVLAMLLALVMLFALAACGNDSANKTDGETAQSEPVQAPETTQPETTATEETESKTEEPETTEPETTEIEPYTVTDTKGNTATFTKVPERVIVINRYNTELLRATGHLDKIVGVDGSIVENNTYWPEFTEANNIGGNGQNADGQDFEIMAAMEPDVIITRSVTDELVEAMSKFDIPVLYLDGANADLIPQFDVIDAIFGQTEESKALRETYLELRDKIETAVATIPEEERLTFAWESVKDYTISSGGNVFVSMVARAGLINALAASDVDTGEMDADAIITANPDVYFKLVTPSAADTAGYTPPTDEDFQTVAQAFLSRPGYENISAVQEGRCYMISSFGVGGFGKLVGSAYILSWLYPEVAQSAGIDPDEIQTLWLEQFQNKPFQDGYFANMSDYAG